VVTCVSLVQITCSSVELRECTYLTIRYRWCDQGRSRFDVLPRRDADGYEARKCAEWEQLRIIRQDLSAKLLSTRRAGGHFAGVSHLARNPMPRSSSTGVYGCNRELILYVKCLFPEDGGVMIMM
jgi:hypothetical protein